MSPDERALLNRLRIAAQQGSDEVRRAILRVLSDSRAQISDGSRRNAYTDVIGEIEAHARAQKQAMDAYLLAHPTYRQKGAHGE
jgi:hypothetical protein